MRPGTRAAVAALAAVLLLQPVLAASVCCQKAAPKLPCCPAEDSTTSQPDKNISAKSSPVGLACCELSSPRPPARQTLLKGCVPALGTSQVEEVAVRAATGPATVPSAPVPLVSSSLHTLYCVFLI